MREYKVKSRVRQTAEVKLEDGMVLTWTKPKDASVLIDLQDQIGDSTDDTLVMLKASISIVNNLERGLPPEQAEYLEKRLRDPEDDFDLDDLRAISDLFEEQTTGVPPTSGGGLSL